MQKFVDNIHICIYHVGRRDKEGRKSMKYVVYGLMVYAFIAASSAKGQSLFDGLLAAGLIYGVYYLIKKLKKNKPPEGTAAAEFRKMADTPGATEAARAREKALLEQKSAGIAQEVINKAEQMARDGKRRYDYYWSYEIDQAVLKGAVAELKRKGFSADYCCSSPDEKSYSRISIKW